MDPDHPDWRTSVQMKLSTTYSGDRAPWYQRKSADPPATGKGEPIVVRMQPPMLAAIDGLIAKQPTQFPSRPKAVRRLIELALKAKPSQ